MPKYRLETDLELRVLPLTGKEGGRLLTRYGKLMQVLIGAMCLQEHPITVRLMRQESEGVWTDISEGE